MSELELPTTHYARSGDISVAYQTMGHGSIDLIVVLGIVSHVEFMHEIIPGWTDLLRRLAAFARVVTFDKRGQGLSDRMPGVPLLEERMDDVSAIMEAIGSKRAVLVGISEGAPMSALFAATYPERVSHLVLWSGFARSDRCLLQRHVQFDTPLPLSIVARPHEAGLIRSWRADSLALVM